MPNHVHLILCPSTPDGLGRALGEAHRRYTGVINARQRVTGHLFQSRFGSVAMDGTHLMAAARHVLQNPVRAGLVARAEDWRWSSARAHLGLGMNAHVELAPLAACCGPDFAAFLAEPTPEAAFAPLRAAETIGRPLGSPAFLDAIASRTGKDPRPGKRGPKRRA